MGNLCYQKFNYPLEMKEIYFFDKKINKITLNSK